MLLVVKGVEDIVNYCYGWLLLCNEVGVDVGDFSLLCGVFYVCNWCCVCIVLYGFVVMVMYDYKCGEDVCVWFVVLSEVFDVWCVVLFDWLVLNFCYCGGVYCDFVWMFGLVVEVMLY